MKLLKDDGAVFEASIEHENGQVTARYLVSLETPSSVLTSPSVRVFDDADAAQNWLDAEAASRGFSKYPLDASKAM